MTVPAGLLDQCLSDLSRRVDEDAEQANLQAWVDFLEDRCTDDVFVPPSRAPAAPGVDWPKVHINDALDDYDAMLLDQFGGCSDLLAGGGNLRMCVRCNYGTGILPTLFGCELFVMPAETNTLPTARPLPSRDRVAALLDAGVPDIRGRLGGKVFASARRFLDVLRRYPVLGRHVALYHPDTQGPVDVAELVWGSDIFYAFADGDELLEDLLDLITETYVTFLRAWFDLAGAPGEHSVHWGLMHKGAVMIRNDSLMNLSPQTYVDFVRPRDQRVLDEFGGGAIHFCGRGEHFIEAMSHTRGLTAVNLSQPELNDMAAIFRHTADAGIKVIGLPRHGVEGLARPRRGQVHVRGALDANRMAAADTPNRP